MLKTVADLHSLREKCQKNLDKQTQKIFVCCGTGCVAGGAYQIHDQLEKKMKELGIKCDVVLEKEPEGDSIGLKKTGCQGFCEKGPLVRIDPHGYLYTKVSVDDCDEIIEKTILKGEFIDRLGYQKDGVIYKEQENVPFYKKQHRTVLGNCGHIDAMSIHEYIASGGYSSLEKALFELSADDIVKEVSDSNLRGRGGGGFQTGYKWQQVKKQTNPQKYIVCNGDEGDPGAFMDSSIMLGDPHRLLEGMIIAGIACGSDQGYIYVRAEYPLAVERLKIAIKEATELGLIGENILGSNFSFSFKINKGAGAFVCGEGSALTASIEGKRGMPRVKPPRTVEKGLFECPTVLNNVETFATVPLIIENGAKWFRAIGPDNSPGTKAFSVTGNIEDTGIVEVAMGTTLREIVFDICGGIRGGKKFKGVQIGGPSGGCLIEKHLDLPLDFDSLESVGAMIGSGGLVVLDEDTCMVEVARFFMSFTQNESCGKCIPCREGTKRMLEILNRIVEGKGELEDIDLLLELADVISNTALCGLGKTAASPVVSTIENFRDEYIEHILEKKCRCKSCEKLKVIVIDKEACKGCSKCARTCPVNAIVGEVKNPFEIDQSKCIKCGACLESCPFNAIKED